MLKSRQLCKFFHVDQFNPSFINHQLQRLGMVSIPLIKESFRKSIMNEVYKYPFQKAKEEHLENVPVLKKQSCVYKFANHSQFHALRKNFQELIKLSSEEFLTKIPIVFNKMELIKYECGHLGISPHRDPAQSINLIVLFMLEGEGKLFWCKDREGNGSMEIATNPGNVVFMRAPGFHNCTVKFGRPFHYVSDIKSERYVFCLRQVAVNHNKYGEVVEFDWRNKKAMAALGIRP